MSNWFDGETGIACGLQDVQLAVEHPGDAFVGMVRLMPGLTSVELEDEGEGFVIIRTNEGVMNRTRIETRVEPERVTIGFDEEYRTSKITVLSHIFNEFAAGESGVTCRIQISDVQARGILGFFYRVFGRSSIGRALLGAAKKYFEDQLTTSDRKTTE